MEQPPCKQPCKELMKMIYGLNSLFCLTFPDLDKNYRKFPDYSRFSLTFHNSGLFSRFSRYSKYLKRSECFLTYCKDCTPNHLPTVPFLRLLAERETYFCYFCLQGKRKWVSLQLTTSRNTGKQYLLLSSAGLVI